jgi:ABC-type maltose transport system permease subunit
MRERERERERERIIRGILLLLQILDPFLSSIKIFLLSIRVEKPVLYGRLSGVHWKFDGGKYPFNAWLSKTVFVTK